MHILQDINCNFVQLFFEQMLTKRIGWWRPLIFWNLVRWKMLVVTFSSANKIKDCFRNSWVQLPQKAWQMQTQHEQHWHRNNSSVGSTFECCGTQLLWFQIAPSETDWQLLGKHFREHFVLVQRRPHIPTLVLRIIQCLFSKKELNGFQCRPNLVVQVKPLVSHPVCTDRTPYMV